MYKTFEYAVGASWVIGMYGTRAIYTVKKAEYRARDRKEIYTIDVDGHEMQCTKNRLHYLLHLGSFKKIQRGNYTKYKIPEPPQEIIRAYYAELREKEEKRLEKLRDKLERDENYKRIKSEISVLSLALAKAEFNKIDVFEQKKLRNKLEAAKEERRAILNSLGFLQEDLKKKIKCSKCGDEGFINGRKCDCVDLNISKIMEYWENHDGQKRK